jgi:hypothetical protein
LRKNLDALIALIGYEQQGFDGLGVGRKLSRTDAFVDLRASGITDNAVDGGNPAGAR